MPFTVVDVLPLPELDDEELLDELELPEVFNVVDVGFIEPLDEDELDVEVEVVAVGWPSAAL